MVIITVYLHFTMVQSHECFITFKLYLTADENNFLK